MLTSMRADRIDSDAQAVAITMHVRQELRALDIDLPQVPVSLVPQLPPAQEGQCLKTFGAHAPFAPAPRSAKIEILSGLERGRFEHVVAHEHSHAMLHLHGGPAMDPDVEEGFCELIAVVWLTSRPTSPAVLRAVWANPHPVYGGEMRRMVRLARRDGVRAVLDRAMATGSPS